MARDDLKARLFLAATTAVAAAGAAVYALAAPFETPH